MTRAASRHLSAVVSAYIALVLAGAALAQDRVLDHPSFGQPGQTDARIALVIGNANYASAPLKNPVNDATDMAAALRAVGFQVTLGTDWTKRQMEDAIRAFGAKLRAGGTGLFYFAGHGVQVRGRNYLVPVGFAIGSESEVEYEAVDAGRVLGQMEDAGNSVNIVILDACRNNPFGRGFRSAEQGLAQVTAPNGSFVAYATAPGSVAADGAGRNGTYTAALLEALRVPNLRVEDVFKRVRQTVARATAQQQIPWDSSSLVGDFYFARSAAPPPTTVAPSAPVTFDLVAASPGGEPADRPFGDAAVRLLSGRVVCGPIGRQNLVMPPDSQRILILLGPGFNSTPSGYHAAEIEIVDTTATSLRVTRPGANNNSSTPAWQIQAFDVRGNQVGATIGEGDVSRGGFVYASTPQDFTVAGAGIKRFRVASNNTTSTYNAVPFARFEITLAPRQ